VWWSGGGLDAATFVNYVGSSRDVDSTPEAGVSPWITVDSQLGYNTSASGGFWGGIRVALTVQNLFDRPPPRIDAAQAGLSGLNFDSSNAAALGCFISAYVSKILF
jgi:outer membrane receptor protein involved in Fe transport